MKNLSVQVGSVQITVNSGTLMFNAGASSGYSNQINVQMSPDIKKAFIAFGALLIETDEGED